MKSASNLDHKELNKLRLVFEQTPGAIFILDREFRFEYVNPGYEKLSGFSKAELIGKSVGDVFAQTDYTEPRKEIIQSMLAGEKWEGEMQTYKKDGSTYWATTVSSPFWEDDGTLEGYIIIQQDVTDRKAIEIALRDSETKYKTLVENSHDGIMIIRDNKIMYGNDTICDMLGFCVIGQTVDIIHPDDRQKMKEIGERRRNGDQSTIHESVRMIAKNGEIKECETTSTMVQFAGEWAAFYTVHDVTERGRLEQELKKRERKYRELAELLPLAVYELDVNGRPTYMNRTGLRLFGWTENVAPDIDAALFFSSEDKALMHKRLQEEARKMTSTGGYVDSESSMPKEYTAISTTGRRIPVMIYGVPILENGMAIGSRGVIVDISERKAMENALRESEEKYRTLIENATDGIVIVQNGLLKFANQTMCDIMKYSMEELINKPFLDYIDVTEHQSLNQFHLRRMQGEQFSNILRSQFIRKDGKMITVELNARTSNYNGAPAGFIVIRDITDRLKIETELQYAKTELEKLNSQLEKRVKESSKRLTEARTQLINLQKENLQSQYDVLKQQVNPHFLFNSLNVLTSLIKLEPDLAEKFSEQLSKVYRYVLENKDNELVDLNTELNFLDAYIFLLNIRFVGKLILNLHIPIENRSDKIIPLAMQLLIENAIKHNVMSKSTPLVIDIFIDENNCLNVINNLQERPSQIVSTGVGLKNILNRYKLLDLSIPIFEKTERQFIAKIQLVNNITSNP